MAVITWSGAPPTARQEENGATVWLSFPQAWHRLGMLINAPVQIAQGSHTSDVSSRDAVFMALALES